MSLSGLQNFPWPSTNKAVPAYLLGIRTFKEEGEFGGGVGGDFEVGGGWRKDFGGYLRVDGDEVRGVGFPYSGGEDGADYFQGRLEIFL
jgi:hypothetical protein